MTESKNSTFNDFLNEFPKQYIKEILNDIDLKINSLHTISSKDFLYLNKLLKDYYKKVNDISEGNRKIKTHFSSELPDIIEKISKKKISQKDVVTQIGDNINQLIDKISLAYSSFDLLIVPFNNFKQNLTTLRYILANINLHTIYIELNDEKEFQASFKALETSIDDIYELVESTDNKKELLVNNFIDIKAKANLIEKDGYQKIKGLLDSTNKRIQQLSFAKHWSEDLIKKLSKHAQTSFANLGEIITNLQYHDIIRQKMEHIQLAQQELIEGLNNLNPKDTVTIDEQINFIVKIPEITDLQGAQLLYTNKDYQTSIEKITTRLIEVSREMESLNHLYASISEDSNYFENNFSNKIKKSNTTFAKFCSKNNERWLENEIPIKNINVQYTEFKGDCNTIFNKEKELRSEIKAFEKLITANAKKNEPKFIQKIKILLSDLQTNSNTIKISLNDATQHLNSIDNLTSVFKIDNNQFQINHEIYQEFEQKSITIKKLAKKYEELSLSVAKEITPTLKNIEYYSYFKEMVKEIVPLLNEINKKVNYQSLKNIVKNNKGFLSKIEEHYTMKSERDIHEKLLESHEDISQMIENDCNEDNMEDNDLELF